LIDPKRFRAESITARGKPGHVPGFCFMVAANDPGELGRLGDLARAGDLAKFERYS